MTAFPDPLDLIYEAAFGAEPDTNPLEWTWTDVSADAKLTGIQDSRGRPDESGQIPPSSASLTLTNEHGNYTPHNASGVFYPNVRLGTPIRIRANLPDPPGGQFPLIEDSFDRTVDGNWGFPSGQGLSWVPLNDNASFSVDGGRGVITFDQGTAISGLAQEVQFFDGDILLSISPGQLSTGGPLLAGVQYRSVGYYAADVLFQPGGTVDLTLSGVFGTALLVIETAVETYAANDMFWLRIQAAGDTHRIRLWADGDPEPGTWLIEHVDTGSEELSGLAGWHAGWINLYAFFTGTNIDPTIAFDDLTVTADVPPVFFGQVAEWTPEWPEGDLSPEGLDIARVQVTAAGFLRRFGQGQQALDSALARRMPRVLTTNSRQIIAYWPMEDEGDATEFASPLSGVSPASFSGDVDLASVEPEPGIRGSKALPLFREGSYWQAAVPFSIPSMADDAGWALNFLYRFNDGPVASDRQVITVWTAGSVINRWRVIIKPTNDVNVEAWDDEGTLIYDAGLGIDPDLLFDRPVRVFFRVWQDGTPDLRYQVSLERLSGEGPTTITGFVDTVVSGGGPIGRPARISGGPMGAAPTDRSWGHLTVYNLIDGAVQVVTDVATDGYNGETAGARIARLCTEEGVAFVLTGDDFNTEPMGPQRPDTLLKLFGDAADVDGGWLSEASWHLGIRYRSRVSAVDQPAWLVLDARPAEGKPEIMPPFRPVEDDQQVRNDVTVSRVEGSSARETDDTDIAGRGRYNEELTLNAATDDRLPQVAAWRLHLGTWPGMRYPQLSPALNQVPELIPTWAGLELGDRIQVINLPPQHPADTVDLLVQGTAETLTPTGWDAVANMSPARPWSEVGVFDGAGDGTDRLPRRFSPTRANLTADVADAATAFAVATEIQPWINSTDHAAQLPFDITVGGEQMTVTGISVPDVDTPVVEEVLADTSGPSPVPATLITDLATQEGWWLIAVQYERQSTGGLISPPAPSGGGWIPMGTAGGGSQPRLTVWARMVTATGSESVTFTPTPDVGADALIANLFVISGVSFELTDSAALDVSSGSSQEPYPAPSVLGRDDGLLLCGWVTFTGTWTPPGSMTELDAQSVNSLASMVASEVLAANGPTGFRFADSTTGPDAHAAFSVALGPVTTQTFTVTRSTNGVTKSHTAGADVSLAVPSRFAL